MVNVPDRIWTAGWGYVASSMPYKASSTVSVEYVRADLFAALEAQLAEVNGLLQEADFWIGGALSCKEWRWDGDQHDAATDTHRRILSALEATPPAPKVTNT